MCLVDREVKAKYDHFLYLATLRSEPTCRWCPRPDCNSAVLGDPDSPDFPMLTCAKCSMNFCYECNLEV